MNKRNFILLILITFVLKAGLAIYFSHLLFCQIPENKIGYIANGVGDTPGYIGSIDNFIEEGTYYFWNGTRRVYAGRMPHYGVPYYIFRLGFSKPVASDIYVLFQILFDAIATVFFALLCFNVLKNNLAFVFGYLIYFLNFNLFWLSSILFTESLSLSFFVLFLYSFHRFWNKEKFSNAILASISLAVVTVLKPYLAIVYLPFFLSIILESNLLRRRRKEKETSGLNENDVRASSRREESILKSFQTFHVWLLSLCRFAAQSYFLRIALLSIPLLILLTPWIARNAIVLGKFIPTQENTTAGYNYTQADFAFRRFVGAWGGDFIYWNPNSAGCYFQFKPSAGCNFTLPGYALTDGYTMNDIEDVRKEYLRLQESYSPELEQTVITKFDRLTIIYRSERPFMYHIGSRIIMVKNLLWHTNTYNLPIHSTFHCYKSFQIFFKAISFLIYLLSITIGFVGLIKLSAERKISFLFASVPLIILCFFATLRFVEYRYFNHAFPIMALGAVSVLCVTARFIGMKSGKAFGVLRLDAALPNTLLKSNEEESGVKPSHSKKSDDRNSI